MAEQNKRCYRCRSLTADGTCSLGYEFDPVTMRPKQACPKPLTWEALRRLAEEREEGVKSTS